MSMEQSYGNKFHTEIYDREYFEGSSAMLFIGDVFVDEVVSYEYSVQEQRIPLRSYASRYREAMTNGIVEVNGTFSINYKESGYLWAILKRYSERAAFLGVGPDPGGNIEIGPLYRRDDKHVHDIMRANIEQMTTWENGGHLTSEKLTEFAHSISGFLTKGTTGQPFDPHAENIFEAYENMLWGPADQSEYGGPGQVTYATDGVMNPEMVPYRKETDPHWQGFDIWITHGDYSGSDLKNHTVRKLIDVVLLGSQQSADPSGNNIIETYLFNAMDRL